MGGRTAIYRSVLSSPIFRPLVFSGRKVAAGVATRTFSNDRCLSVSLALPSLSRVSRSLLPLPPSFFLLLPANIGEEKFSDRCFQRFDDLKLTRGWSTRRRSTTSRTGFHFHPIFTARIKIRLRLSLTCVSSYRREWTSWEILIFQVEEGRYRKFARIQKIMKL